MKKPTKPEQENVDNKRREFLRRSVYAAYATPVITALLVEEASAAKSNFCDKHPWHPKCQ